MITFLTEPGNLASVWYLPPDPSSAGVPATRQFIIRALDQATKWLLSKRGQPGRAGDPWHAVNILVGTLDCLNQCGYSIQSWLDRRTDRRRILRDIRNRYATPAPNKVLRDLVALAKAAVSACSWRSPYPLGALPSGEPRPATDAQRAAMAIARRAQADERTRAKEAREARFAEEVGFG
jgi:hypothetical protein